MGLFESSIASILADDNSATTAYTRKKEIEAERENRQQTIKIERANTATTNMLARPDLVDSRAAALAAQFNTTLAKPKFTKFANKTDAIDAIDPENPMSGTAGKIKEAFTRNLSMSTNTGKSMLQIENEAVRSVITPELVDKAHEHQFKKDTSFGNAFGIFGGTKSGTKPLPGYEEWRERKRAAGKKEATQFDIFSAEGAKEGAIGGATMAGFAAALATGAAVVGTAPVSVPAIVGSAIVAGLAAIPATMAARKVQSIAENSDWQAANPDSIAPHIAGAAVGAIGGGGLARVGAMAIKNAATKKLAGEAAEAFITSTSGKLANSAVNVATGAGAVAGGAVGAAEPGLALDLVTFIGAEQALMKGGKAGLTKLIEKSMLSDTMTKIVASNPTGANIINAHKANVLVAEEIAFTAITKENTLATLRKAEEAHAATNAEFAAEREATRLARPQLDEAATSTYLAGEGLTSDVTNRQVTTTAGKGKKARTVVQNLGNNEDDLIIRGLREKGLVEDSESFTARITKGISDEGFTKTLNPETAVLKSGTIDEKLAVQLQVEEIAKRTSITAAEHRLLQVQGDLLSSVGPKGSAFNPTAQMEVLKGKNNAYGDVGQLDTELLNSDLAATGAGTLGKHVQNVLEGQTGKFDKIKATTYQKERDAWKKAYGITAAGIAGVSLLTAVNAHTVQAETVGVPTTADGSVVPTTNNTVKHEDIEGPVIPNESDESRIERLSGDSLGKRVLYTVATALENSPLVNLLGGSEAHAGTASTIAKAGLSIPKVLEEYFTTAFGKGTKALQAVVDGGFVGKPLEKNALTMRGTLPTGDFSTVPDKALLEKVFGDAADVAGSGAMTPMGRANLVSRSVMTGEGAERVTTGLAPVELAYRMTEAQNATSKGHEILANMERIYGIDMGKDSVTKATMEHMAPIQDATSLVFARQQVMEHSMVELTTQERALTKLINKGQTVAKDGAVIQTLIDDIVGKKETISAAMKTAEPEVLKATQQIQSAYEELAGKNVRTRLSLAAEDSADYKRYPFLKNMMTENEKLYVESYKDYMLHMRERIEAAGGKAIKSEFFVHHSLQKTAAFEEGTKELQKMLADFNIPNADVVLANSKFHSRTKFSHNFVPDIKYNSAEYIADAERRIAGMNFWKVGSPDGWDAVRKSSIALNSKKITGFFQALDDGMRPIESTFSNKAADMYSKIEVIRLLGGSISAPFKHLLKLQADAATYGAVNTLGTIPEALGVAGRNFVRNQVGKLVDAKFLPAEFGSKLWASSKEMDHVVQSMTSQKNMINYLSEIEQGMGSPYRGLASKFVDGITEAAGFGIKAVESFDRTLTVLAAAKMAQKNGMTAQQAIYGSYETMLLNNFMGGALNSAWGRNPKVRAAMLFQNTPFKIWERRLVAAINAGKDLQTTVGKIKNGDLEKEWQALQKIKGDMKEGEYRFKAGILFDSLTASKNAFGNSSSGILVKELMGVGAIMAGSSAAFGVDMAPQFLHLPFVKTEGGTAELSTSPLIQSTLKTAAGQKPYGVDDTEWDEENKPFFMSTFFNHWKGSSGYSLFASKMGRINENDIPEMYGSSVGKYLFALKNKE